ncbi:hypothetical protein Sipo8835_01885 [Streptomyces ipomoeae]|uniref:Uncharacterized protein n=1 Tax=Streptomyces ipomoeae TaxID=103232 RepID=A0AAE8W9M7_9ACTN|nr:hypothetical protein Sipo8835_01885 [Streptomyces ipomoeae]
MAAGCLGGGAGRGLGALAGGGAGRGLGRWVPGAWAGRAGFRLPARAGCRRAHPPPLSTSLERGSPHRPGGRIARSWVGISASLFISGPGSRRSSFPSPGTCPWR